MVQNHRGKCFTQSAQSEIHNTKKRKEIVVPLWVCAQNEYNAKEKY